MIGLLMMMMMMKISTSKIDTHYTANMNEYYNIKNKQEKGLNFIK